MKATDLRIGNLVTMIDRSGKVHIPNGVVYKIYSINIFTCVICDARLNFTECQQSDLFDVNISDLSPIPLTEQILFKCGFEETYRSKFRVRYDHKEFTFVGYDIKLSEISNLAEGFRFYDRYLKVEYLHELQNAFKVLTGEELKYTP